MVKAKYQLEDAKTIMFEVRARLVSKQLVCTSKIETCHHKRVKALLSVIRLAERASDGNRGHSSLRRVINAVGVTKMLE